MANPFLGVFLHWLGGLASGSFYVPYKGVRRWSWETYWLVGGCFSWILCPWLLASLMTADVPGVLSRAPIDTLGWAYFFGVLWGFGGLTFGLTMRYLGMSLGMGVALGYCAAFGTLVPPIFRNELWAILNTHPGQVTLFGVVVCLLGIAVAAYAGLTKEREMSDADKKKAIAEFNFTKGILVATFSGIMSACFAFGLAAGKPIEDLTYCSDLVHSAAKAGKPITGPAMVDSNNATNLVKALAVRGFFKGGSGEAPASAPTFNDVIDSLEAPVSLALRMDALQAAPGGAGGAEAADRQAQLAQLKAELEAAARVLPAKLAALKTVNNTLAVRLRRYQENIQDLRGKGAEWAVIAAMKDLPRKEVAVATLRSGLDFLALHRKHQLWTGLPVLIVVLLGGFTTNFLWCVMLNLKNRTGYQYFASRLRPEHAGLAGAGETHGPGGTDVIPAARDLRIPRLNNLLFSALAGTTWYFQFFFYTMGATQMGKYDFASWTLHMASIIIFSTMWGWILREWKGSSKKAHGLIAAGIATLILSTIIIGFGTWLKGQGGGQ